jgi:spore maturation protein CgeB
LCWLYAQHPGLEKQPYDEQMQARNDSLFSVADFYSSNLRKLGHEAWDIHVNNEFMQKAWARKHGMQVAEPAPAGRRWRKILQQARRTAAKTPVRYLKPLLRPMLRSLDSQQAWFYDILAAQIKHYKPDVLLNQDIDWIHSHFLWEMKPYVRLLVGQIASPLPEAENFSCYDLVISSLPNLVEHFRRIGMRTELHRLAFEPRVLSRLKKEERPIAISFVGSLSKHHEARVHLLAYLCERLDVEVWGQGVDSLPAKSPIRRRYKGRAWGIEMYQLLYNSKMTLNHHIGVAESYANNMRLFEATGVGTLLITDWKVNLHEMFELGKEVVAYCTPEECATLIQYYLEHDDEREAIARAGQQRTLREHTYYQRMQELVEIVQRYL